MFSVLTGDEKFSDTNIDEDSVSGYITEKSTILREKPSESSQPITTLQIGQ
jgi:hypothetical protein